MYDSYISERNVETSRDVRVLVVPQGLYWRLILKKAREKKLRIRSKTKQAFLVRVGAFS